MGFFNRLKEGLEKTRKNIAGRIDQMLAGFGKVDEELFEELEEILLTADLGTKVAAKVVENVRKRVKDGRITEPVAVRGLVKDELIAVLKQGMGDETWLAVKKEALSDEVFIGDEEGIIENEETVTAGKVNKSGSTGLMREISSLLGKGTPPAVILIVGVNGVGKTTSIGKIAYLVRQSGKRAIIAAADTFRAAAIDQLEIWAGKAGVEIIAHSEGSDPAAVVFDSIIAAKARKADVLICDTAGRLHTKKNLMDELKKIHRIITRELPSSQITTLIVLDATTGQNALTQARTFNAIMPLDGIILTKLDGTAKGGIVVAIKADLGIPVRLAGVGEKLGDLQFFNPVEFIDAIFGQT
ncbi:MAG: signal recognition particle-docking protein FtsY [Clostridiales bacterium]|nr:signal recognition particle-docking protein FtsY [Clostridiales bacterium]